MMQTVSIVLCLVAMQLKSVSRLLIKFLLGDYQMLVPSVPPRKNDLYISYLVYSVYTSSSFLEMQYCVSYKHT